MFDHLDKARALVMDSDDLGEFWSTATFCYVTALGNCPAREEHRIAKKMLLDIKACSSEISMTGCLNHSTINLSLEVTGRCLKILGEYGKAYEYLKLAETNELKAAEWHELNIVRLSS